MVSNEREMKRVAVIAVHGVADQQVLATARSVADILFGPHTEGKYAAFVEENIRIGLEPVRLRRKVEIDTKRERIFDISQMGVVSRRVQQVKPIVYESFGKEVSATKIEKKAERDDEKVEHENMREQLQGYTMRSTDTRKVTDTHDKTVGSQDYTLQTADQTLDTVVLRSRRDERKYVCDVDVYKLFWTDLSRLRSGFSLCFFRVLPVSVFPDPRWWHRSRASGCTFHRPQDMAQFSGGRAAT